METMTDLKPVDQAVAEHLAKIEAEERRLADAQAAREADAEVRRQEFIAALRERIELQYGLLLTDADVAGWQVTKMSSNLYDMRWLTPEGNITLSFNASTDDISIGGVDIITWLAYHTPSRQTITCDRLIPALTYARTGKHL